MNKFNIAVAQMDSREDTKKNLEVAEQLIREAAEKGAKLIAFPENMDYIGEDYKGNAKKNPGPIVDFFSRLAKEEKIYLHCGSITEFKEGEKPFNTSLLFNPEGRLIGRYSKLHMFDVAIEEGPSYKESDETNAGDEIVIIKTNLAVFGMAICYDMRFPEIFKLMAQNEAQVIFVPADFTLNTGKDHWEPLLKARAIENTCFIVAPGQIGLKKHFRAYGKSMIIDPWGNIIAQASDTTGLVMTEIDLDLIPAVRAQIPSLTNCRQDIYTLRSDKIKIYKE